MSYKSDVDNSGRQLFFNPSGNDSYPGTSRETAVETPNRAIALVNALDPVPSSTVRASIVSQSDGVYPDSIVIPEFTTFDAPSVSIITFQPINVTVSGSNPINMGVLLNFSSGGTCFKSADNIRVLANISTMVVAGADGIGFDISGASDDSFFILTQGALQAERATMVKHTSTSVSPISYNFELVEMFDIDQIYFDYNPMPGSSSTIVKGSTVSPGSGASTAGCTLFMVRAGILVVAYEVLVCDTIADVFAGAILALTAQVIAGNTISRAGGICVYRGTSLLIGDLTTEVGATIQADAYNITGNVVNAGSMSIRCDQLTGDIDNDGDMFVIIGNHDGAITGTGTIDGWINGEPYGNAQEAIVLQGSDFTDQIPTGLDAPLQVKFGAAQGSITDPVMLSAAGEITANKKKKYLIDVVLQYSRDNAGAASWLVFRAKINGIQLGDSILAKLDNANSDIPFQFLRRVDMLAGDVLTIEVMRDSQGFNDGELITNTPTLIDFNPIPSASITVSI